MKKLSLLIALLFTVLVACSDDDKPAVDAAVDAKADQSIAIDAVPDKPSTQDAGVDTLVDATAADLSLE